MATTTSVLDLTKLEDDDLFDIGIISGDLDLLDEHIASLGVRPVLFTPPAPIVVSNILGDLDSTNLKVAFGAPISQRVVLQVSLYMALTAGSGSVSLSVRDSANAVVGAAQKVTGSSDFQRFNVPFVISTATGNLSYKISAQTSGPSVAAQVVDDPVVIQVRSTY